MAATKPRKTLAEHTADVMNEQGMTRVDVGILDVLSEAYDRAGGRSQIAPWYRNALVTKALASTKAGRARFRIVAQVTMYPGIINTTINVFELREEYRTAPGPER